MNGVAVPPRAAKNFTMEETTEILAGDVMRRLRVAHRKNPQAWESLLGSEDFGALMKLQEHLETLDRNGINSLIRLQGYELERKDRKIAELELRVRAVGQEDSLLKNVPPHNLEAERAVLGSILLDGSVLADLGLTVEDFYRPKNAIIFAAILGLEASGTPVDAVTLVSELRQRRKLEEAGGPVEISVLSEVVPTSANARYYAKLVKDASIARDALGEFAQAQREIFEGPVDAKRVHQKIREIAAKFDASGVRPFDDPPVRSTD